MEDRPPPPAAIDILRVIQADLQRRWRLRLGDDSNEILVVAGHPHETDDFGEYKKVEHISVLGHKLTDTGSTA